MPIMIPEFRFMYSTPDGRPRILDSAKLQKTVPMARDEFCSQEGPSISYVKYMEAIKAFILENLSELHLLISEKVGDKQKIKSIDLVAEKRGADYFPASVRVRTGNNQIWFAANVALTERGLIRIRQDYDLLKFLGSKDEKNFLPEVFFINTPLDLSSSITGSPNQIFLAEWFRGYHEFHVTNLLRSDQSVFSLWDIDDGYRVFPESIAIQLIEQVSYLMTYFFDLETFQEIYPWHHAAGDFIAKLDPCPDVKLITVRQYESRVSFHEDSNENLNEALLIFFANLTIRARIDRIDGTGELSWLREKFVEPIFIGFLKAIMAKDLEKHRNYDFLEKFIKTLEGLTMEDWARLFVQTMESYDQRAPDFRIIKDNLVDHVFDVYQNCQKLIIENKIHVM